jgi:predicted O-methyltransferase YrrM
MLSFTPPIFDSACESALCRLYGETEHLGWDGRKHVIDGTTRVSQKQGERLAAVIQEHGCKKTLEIGFAYGFSTLYFLGALANDESAHHTAVDPFELSVWKGIGLEKVKEAGMTERFTWIDESSFSSFARLNAQGERFDFIYIDGDHKFDSIMMDIYGSDRLLGENGLLAIDDLWMPSTRAAISFLESNLEHYQPLPSGHKNLALYKKIGVDKRAWWHYTPFNLPQESGQREPGQPKKD